MALNAFHGTAKVVVVNVGNNQLTKDIIDVLRSQNFNNVVELAGSKSYPGYYSIVEEDPAYTIIVDVSNECKVQPCKVKGYSGKQLGKVVSRNLVKSNKAKNLYKHYLKMLGLDPKLIGVEIVDFDAVSDMPWYWENDTPLLYLHLPNVAGVAEAVCNAVADYFKR